MTLPIEEMGGMTKGDIQALVLTNNVELQKAWEQKLNNQTETLVGLIHEERAQQEEKLDGFMRQLRELHASDARQLREWHDTDVAFREQTGREMGELRKGHEASVKTQEEISKTVRSINWLIRTTACARNIVVESLVIGKGASKFWAWAHGIGLAWVVFWTFMHTALPAIRYSIEHRRIAW